MLPPELRFGYTDSLDFKSKQDAERYLGRFMLVNLDEFDQINLNQQGFLKHLLQKPVQTKTRDRLSISKIACFGRSLRKLDIPCKKSNRGTVYLLEKVG